MSKQSYYNQSLEKNLFLLDFVTKLRHIFVSKSSRKSSFLHVCHIFSSQKFILLEVNQFSNPFHSDFVTKNCNLALSLNFYEKVRHTCSSHSSQKFILSISTDEGSFITRIFVFTRLLLVFSKYQRGQILPMNWYLFFYNEDQF